MWPNPQETVDLVTFAEEILNEKIHFLYSEIHGLIHHHIYWKNTWLGNLDILQNYFKIWF